MDKIKLKLRPDEFRFLHDLISYLLLDINKDLQYSEDDQHLRALMDFVILQRFLQKKMAAKVIILKKSNDISISLDEAVVLYMKIGELIISELDDFSGAMACFIMSAIEPKIFNHVGFYRKEQRHKVLPHIRNAQASQILPA